MKNLLQIRFPRLLVALIAITTATLANAQDDYPARPINLIVAYSAGGSTDSIARPFAEVLARVLKTAVVIDNVSGAAGAMGAQKAANARPDGYTLLLGANGELVATKLLNPSQRYDAIKDFTAIGMITRQGGVLLASPQTGIKTTDQFIQLLRKNPGKYNYASSGVGSMFHFAGELVRERTGTQITHVAYRSISALSSDLMGGAVEFGFMGTAPAKALIDAGMLVPIAVTSGTRTPIYPNVPALAEHPELKGYDLTGWFALMAPKGLPEPVVAKLKAALKETLKDAHLRQILNSQGSLPMTEEEDVPKVIREETLRYKKFVDTAHLLDAQK